MLNLKAGLGNLWLHKDCIEIKNGKKIFKGDNYVSKNQDGI